MWPGRAPGRAAQRQSPALTPGRGAVRWVISRYVKRMVWAMDVIAGIEIEVRPAGRNVRRVSLLSGGERSMAALAFLFAVFRSRPSPFYLLDEVEAALDDVNLHRFLDLLHEFRGEAQLIIVGHQKRTMEAADALYGVTMTPGGSSKVVSQKVRREPSDA